MAETKPTPGEIGRAKRLSSLPGTYSGDERYSPRTKAIAQALADAREQERERCAKIINAQEGMQGWKHRILSTIRRGEP